MITTRQPSRNVHDGDVHTLTIKGEPASKSNARQLVLIRGRMVPIKSKKALAYEKMFKQQCPKLEPLLEEDLAVAMRIFYKTRRPDLDESLILDLLQDKVYKNDRCVKLKYIEHGLSKEDPRVVICIGPLEQVDEVINTYRSLMDNE